MPPVEVVPISTTDAVAPDVAICGPVEPRLTITVSDAVGTEDGAQFPASDQSVSAALFHVKVAAVEADGMSNKLLKSKIEASLEYLWCGRPTEDLIGRRDKDTSMR